MSDALLEVRKLRKFFPVVAGFFRHQVGEVKAVNEIDFTLNKGQVLGLVGETGCGKSTAARAAVHLIPPTSGTTLFNGKDLSTLSRKEMLALRLQTQIVFQDPYASLNPRKNVLEAVGEALLVHGRVKDRKEQRDAVAALLDDVGLSPDVMGRYPHEFSGGQQQRIGIGRALALQPALLICDEAVSALDVSVQAQILNLLLRLKEQKNLSYLFISHDLSVIRHISDTVVVMYLGKVMERGPVNAIFSNPKHPYTQALLSAVPRKKPREKQSRIILHGEIPSPRHPPSGCPFRTRCPYAQPICAEPPPMKQGSTGQDYFCILD